MSVNDAFGGQHLSEKSYLAQAISQVVANEQCTGCGACAQFPGVSMSLQEGYMRPQYDNSATETANSDRFSRGPVRTEKPAGADSAAILSKTARQLRREDKRNARLFRKTCPGRIVRAGETVAGARRDEVFGPYLQIVQAWAIDDEIRFQGSSGGVLTALTNYLLESGQSHQVIGASRADNPRETVTVQITSRAEALAAAGSRYGPCANAAHPDALSANTAVIGKPCEVTALRALGAENAPLLLSFFCAGTPNQFATDRLIVELGLPAETPLTDMWYRGRGWPGDFTAVSATGESVSENYEKSWGAKLGPHVQWRCRLCPDGVGEAADIAVGDFWHTDEKGYPLFSDQAGRSVLIARTEKGQTLLQEAVAAGIIATAEVQISELLAVQPYQVGRRRYLLGRLAATRLLGKKVPRVYKFGILRTLWRDPKRLYMEFRGTITRLRHRRPALTDPRLDAPENL